jgi:predicted enzyme related to lactoylglutathione lyase
MIRGIHGLFYSSDPEATRAFFRDQVRLPGSDVGDGWWIFDVAEGDMGVHPAEDPSYAGKHDVSFYCDDIDATVADLKSRGVAFTKDVEDHGYGLVTYFAAPGGVTVQLYQPRYVKASSGRVAKRQKSRRAAKPKSKTIQRRAKKAVAKRRR